MTIGAIQAERGRRETHRPHEFLDGNAAEDPDILERLFRQLRSLLAWLPDGTGLTMTAAAMSRQVIASPAPHTIVPRLSFI